ncbi:ATP-binding protein [Myxococcota bacterium]|nr:ATP-binding protein [Myxococcota bacterium]
MSAEGSADRPAQRPGPEVPVYPQLARLLALLTAGVFVLGAGVAGAEYTIHLVERELYELHQPGRALASALYGAAVGARADRPAAALDPAAEALFVARMHIAHRRVRALGDELLALYAAHPGPPFDARRARLAQVLGRVRDVSLRFGADERGFAEAFSSGELAIDHVALQLERLHQIAADELVERISRTRTTVRLVFTALALLLLGAMGAFARRSLAAIRTSLQRERAAREALQLEEHAMASALMPMAIIGGEARLVYVNPAFLSWLGLRSEVDALGRTLSDLLPSDALERAIAEALRRGHWQGEITAELDAERRIDVILSASVVRSGEGETPYVMVSALDLTERRRLETQLLQAQKMESIGRLAGGIAHDFNNQLTVIIGNVALAREELPPDAPLDELLTDVSSAASSGAHLTRQLLAFSRRQIIEPRVVDLNEVVAGLGKMLPRLLGENVSLRVFTAPDLGPTRLDPGQAEQMLLNLALNAKDAMPQGGVLTIETANVTLDDGYVASHPQAKPGPHVMVAVSDSGIGMTAAVKEHVFEPFFTTKPKGQGTGLGLAMVYGAVKQNGGTIEVYSEPGSGTTFKIYLPRVAAELEPEEELESSDLRGTETVLLVEDDERVRAAARRALLRHGYTVHAHASAADALDALASLDPPPALLVTDVVLGGMNGAELAEKVKAVMPGIRVLFASGYTENVIVSQGVLHAGIEFIGKPYAPGDLARRVRELLDRPAGADA